MGPLHSAPMNNEEAQKEAQKGEQCSQAASPARLWVGLGRPGLLLEPAGPDCRPQSGF